MKCIKNLKTGQISRVADKVARKLVNGKDWAFVAKKEWKAQR
jgi:hypothetical protein